MCRGVEPERRMDPSSAVLHSSKSESTTVATPASASSKTSDPSFIAVTSSVISRTAAPRLCASRTVSAMRRSERVKTHTSRVWRAVASTPHNSSRAATEGKKSVAAAAEGGISRSLSRVAASEPSDDRSAAISAAAPRRRPRRRISSQHSSVAVCSSQRACTGRKFSRCSNARQAPSDKRPDGAWASNWERAAATFSSAAPWDDWARPIAGGRRAARPRSAACSLVAAAAVETGFEREKAAWSRSNSALYADTSFGSEETRMFSQLRELAAPVQLKEPVARMRWSTTQNLWCIRFSRSPSAFRPLAPS
mmetsp:Transcript_49408/g.158772  ORF Transcript_49408/g.158772 Transcript_49408/m.158772 type:complete len:308 (+) Transcript_49408:632-1555(+)